MKIKSLLSFLSGDSVPLIGCSGHFDSFIRCAQCRYEDSYNECETWRMAHQAKVYEVP